MQSCAQLVPWKSCLVLLLCTGAAIASPAQTFTTLTTFDWSNGANPAYAPLVQGLDGNFYGTTNGGGPNGSGTVFKVTPGGALTTLYSFCQQAKCVDGAGPPAGLVLATSGNFYGTTLFGGANNYGTVFKITSTGKLTVLYSFCTLSNCTDGWDNTAGLIQATDGNFYGTTAGGGSSGYGSVFKITPSGALTTLHSFIGSDGNGPAAGLIQAIDGKFYGTTMGGGSRGLGTVFKITAGGKLVTLHSFTRFDGDYPVAALVQGTDGNLYEAASARGGSGYGDAGTIFKISLGGNFTKLYGFCSQKDCTDGASPRGALVQAIDGNFYGTTAKGGAHSGGTVFKLTPSGALATLYSFCAQGDCTDGYFSNAGLVQATNGAFFGMTDFGGNDSNRNCIDEGGCGTVFGLDVGLGSFVEALPYSGKVGKNIKILGQGLTGTTSVSFNGTSASFTVKSDTYLTATVPSSATTGFVTVTTPGGLLKSNQQFRVIP
jgi:uncharacterized repeat protein (TIGR03803 family)